MPIPNEKVEIIDETAQGAPVASEIETEDKSTKEVDDTTVKEEESKKEEEANQRINRLEQSNKRLMEIFTSPEFFAKLGKSMKPEPTKAEPTAEVIQAEKQKLEDMDRTEFLTHTLSQVGKVASAVIKPEIDKLATQMSTFISGQAEGTAGTAVQNFVDRVGQAEFDKYGAAMEAKANATRGNSMDDLYTLVSGKKASRYAPSVVPNNTMKPGEGLKELTEQKDLPLKEAGSRNFDHIFGKYKK